MSARLSELEFLVKCLLLVLLVVGTWIINPLDRYNQKIDSDTEKTAQLYLDAVHTYYDKTGGYPWSSSPYGSECLGRGVFPDGSQTLAEITPYTHSCSSSLFDNSPLKDNIPVIPHKILEGIMLSYDLGTNTNYVCFKPKSAYYLKDPNSIYSNRQGTKAINNSCKAQGGDKACYWCAS